MAQFSSSVCSFTISILSFRKLHTPPSSISNDGKKCVGYDFNGGGQIFNVSEYRDENGEEIPNITEYFK
jgi:hypothetical protein